MINLNLVKNYYKMVIATTYKHRFKTSFIKQETLTGQDPYNIRLLINDWPLLVYNQVPASKWVLRVFRVEIRPYPSYYFGGFMLIR